MISFTQQLEEMVGAEQLTVEQAQALKRERRASKDSTNKDLDALMKQYIAEENNQFYQGLHGVDLVLAKVKTFFGRGQQWEYKQHLKHMTTVSAQLNTMADNAAKVTGEYRNKMVELRNEINEEREIFELNAVMYTGKQKAYSQLKEHINTIEKQTVLGASCTAEAMKLQKELLELENDLIQLNQENDDLSQTLLVKRGVLETYHTTHAAMQDAYSALQRQRTVYNTHLDFAVANEKLMQGVHGFSSVKHIYMEAGKVVQQLKHFQEQLSASPIAKMPAEFNLATPRIDTIREPHAPHWLTVAEQIRKPLYDL